MFRKYFKNIRKHLLVIILIALVITCLAVTVKMAYDINEIYKHIDLLNLFYRSLSTGTPV